MLALNLSFINNNIIHYRISYPTLHLKELEIRLETQKQTLIARDESIKKLLEMLQNKGMGEWKSIVLAWKKSENTTHKPLDTWKINFHPHFLHIEQQLLH